MSRFLVFAVWSLTFIATDLAHAEWLFNKQDKPFGGIQLTTMTFGTGAAFMAACDGGKLIVSVPSIEAWSDTLEAANLVEPKIIVAIDGAPPIRLSATLGQNAVGKVLTQANDEDEVRPFIEKLIAGKKNLDFAVEIKDQRFYESRVSVSGSGKHLKAILEGCPHKG